MQWNLFARIRDNASVNTEALFKKQKQHILIEAMQ